MRFGTTIQPPALSLPGGFLLLAVQSRHLMAHTHVPLDDCLYVLQATIPGLTHSSLHRCLERQVISRLPEVEGDKSVRKKFEHYPIGYFHIDLAALRTAARKLHLFVATDRTSRFAFVELVKRAAMRAAAPFWKHSSPRSLIASTPCSPTTESSSPTCPGSASGQPPWAALAKCFGL